MQLLEIYLADQPKVVICPASRIFVFRAEVGSVCGSPLLDLGCQGRCPSDLPAPITPELQSMTSCFQGTICGFGGTFFFPGLGYGWKPPVNYKLHFAQPRIENTYIWGWGGDAYNILLEMDFLFINLIISYTKYRSQWIPPIHLIFCYSAVILLFQ